MEKGYHAMHGGMKPMNVNLRVKESFCVIGKEGKGTSQEALIWIPPLWEDANKHLDEIRYLAKKDDSGSFSGFWGAMTDLDHTYQRWNGSGKYLAGVEAERNALAPHGWTKWVIPGYIYAVIKVENEQYQATFQYMLDQYLVENRFKTVGAIHEYYNPTENGQLYLYFPIERI